MIRILTDSSAGFSLESAEKFGVEMRYLPINFDGKEFLDVKELPHEQFYVELKASKTLPKTSAVNQTAFEEVFDDVKKKGDEMIVLLISDKISATHGQAVAAKEAVGYDKIHIVDTRRAALPLYGMVMEAIKLRNAKKSAAEIVAEMEKIAPKAKLFACLDTLKYLRAGGRISGASAVVGSILGIKPIAGLNLEGFVTSFHKTIGMRKATMWTLDQMKNADFNYPVYFGHTNSIEDCEKFKALAKERYPQLIVGDTLFISATIAVHAGPGCLGIGYIEK